MHRNEDRRKTGRQKYTHIHTHMQKQTQTDRQTHTHSHSHTHTQTCGHKYLCFVLTHVCWYDKCPSPCGQHRAYDCLASTPEPETKPSYTCKNEEALSQHNPLEINRRKKCFCLCLDPGFEHSIRSIYKQ